jgi:hypothetical protein
MKLRLRQGIIWATAAACAGGELIGGEKADAPPHVHQESVPQGPNVYTQSFAWNGGDTSTAVVHAIRTGI